MEYPKTHTCRVRPFNLSWTILGWLIGGAIFILVVTSSVERFIFLALYALFFFYPSKISFTLTPEGLTMSSGGIEDKFVFASSRIVFDPLSERSCLLGAGFQQLALDNLPEKVLYDIFEIVPSSLPVSLGDLAWSRPKALDDEPQDGRVEGMLAAQAFRLLDHEKLPKALVGRQMLRILAQKALGHTPWIAVSDKPQKWESVFSQDDADFESEKEFIESDDLRLSFKTKEWKDWLADEYGERAEVFAYTLERDFIKRVLYYIVLPGVVLCPLCLGYPEMFTYVVTAVAMIFFGRALWNRWILLRRYKRAASEMRIRRTERDASRDY
jgi:hypothetical protein